MIYRIRDFLGEKDTFTEDIVKQYLNEVRRIPRLNPHDKERLIALAKQGDPEAVHKLVKDYLMISVNVAKRYSYSQDSFINYIQAANKVLIKVIKNFKGKTGDQLRSKLFWHAKQAIRREIQYQGRDIRVPVHIWESASKLKRLSTRLAKQYGRHLSLRELSEESGLPYEEVKKVMTATKTPIPFYTPTGDGQYLEDVIIDTSVDVQQEAINNIFRQKIRSALPELDEKARKAIEYKFGFTDGEYKTLTQTAEKFNTTLDDMMKIIKRGLDLLRLEYKKQGLQQVLYD